ncbi:MAG: exosortase/archaeosortase family protein [Phycisphaerae bacterium]
MTNRTNNVASAGAKPSGRLSEMVVTAETPSVTESFPPATLLKMGVLAALLVLLHYSRLVELVVIWYNEPNWSHGFLIPLFSAFLLYSRRDELLSAPRRVCIWGLPVMILALLIEAAAVYPIRNTWIYWLAMVMLTFGTVLYLGGTRIIRITALPILYFVLAIPIPNLLYERIALPLQNLAARASALLLRALGTEISVRASQLEIISVNGNWYPLTVAEACSGVRSLLAYVALGVAWAYLTDRPIWQRVVLVLAAVPIAIITNMARVSITCGMYAIDRPELGSKFMHEFTGMLMLVPALLMFWGLAKLLGSLFVEEEDDPDDSSLQSEASDGGTA